MLDKSNIFKLKESKKKAGDLITYISTDEGAMVVIIDKGNPEFINAQAGEIWEVSIRTREESSFALGDLVRKVVLDYSVEHTTERSMPVGLVIRDKSTKVILMTLPLSQTVKLEGPTIALVKHAIKHNNLEHFAGEILEEAAEAMDWYVDQAQKCNELVKDVMYMLEQTPKPEVLRDAFEVKAISEMEVESEVWKLVNPFELPSAEDVAEQVMVALSCWHEEKEGFLRMNF